MDIFPGNIAVHCQLMAAHLLAQGPACLFFFRRVTGQGNSFVVSAVYPSHHLMVANPPFVLHRREHGSLFRSEFPNHLISHRLIGVETVDGVQITAEILGPAQCGELIFQRKRFELLLKLFDRRAFTPVPSMQRHSEIVQVQEIAGGKEDMLALAVRFPRGRYNVQRDILCVNDLLNICRKTLLFFRHVTESLQARRVSMFSVHLPVFVGFPESLDLVTFRDIIVIAGVQGAAVEIEIHRHGMELRPGIPAIGRPVPALELITEHQHERKRVVLHAQGRFPFLLVLVEGDGELEKAVMEQDGRKGIHMQFFDVRRADGFLDLAVEPAGAEEGVVHKVAEITGGNRLALQDIQHLFFGKTVAFPQLGSDIKCQDLHDIPELPVVEPAEPPGGIFADPGQELQVMIGNIQAPFSAFDLIDFEIRDDLFKGQFKRIADIMKEGGQAPVFQEQAGGFAVCLPVVLFGADPVEFFESPAEGLICLIDGQAQGKHIYRVGIMIPVFHEQGTAVGLILGQQLHHLFGFAVMAEEDLQIAVIDIISVLRDAGIDKTFQRLLQAQAVDVHLHVVGNLGRFQAGPLQDAGRGLPVRDLFVELQLLTAFMQKAERRGLEVCPYESAAAEGRLARAHIPSVLFQIFLSHLFQRGICHGTPFFGTRCCRSVAWICQVPQSLSGDCRVFRYNDYKHK